MARRLSIHFRKPGLWTTVQDAGRAGHQAYGVPEGGAADQSSCRLANWLVDNPAHAPVLEITMNGPTVEFSESAQIALCGANIEAKIDGQMCPMYQTVTVSKGSTLSFGRLVKGCRTYLAIRGEWQLQPWLGSVSAAPRQAADRTPDSYVKKGDALSIETDDQVVRREIEETLRPTYPTRLRLRVVAGPELRNFSPVSVAYFFSRGFEISNQADRMGYRLEQAIWQYTASEELISSAVLPGTIQVTGSGQAIVLMPDAQTSGGYPRIASVITADLDRLAQTKPGDELWFTLVNQEEAQMALQERENDLQRS